MRAAEDRRGAKGIQAGISICNGAHRIINLTNLALTFKISELGYENSPERRKISIESMNAEPQIVPVKLPGNRPLFAGRARSAANVVVVVSLISIILLIPG